MTKAIGLLTLLVFLFGAAAFSLAAESPETGQTAGSDRHLLDEIESEVAGAYAALFAFLCALWAQNTGRNPWLWFFLGGIFTFIAGFVMLYKNSKDRKQRRQVEASSQAGRH